MLSKSNVIISMLLNVIIAVKTTSARVAEPDHLPFTKMTAGLLRLVYHDREVQATSSAPC